jgi:hypothetical protein
VIAVLATCNSGSCPTIFLQDNDDVLVQGYAAPDAYRQVDVPEGEQLVRIPRSVLLAAAGRLTGSAAP